MIKYATIALLLLTVATASLAQNRADTSIALSVYNTGVSFKLMPADFGGVITTDLVATMVMSYDTVMGIERQWKKRHRKQKSCPPLQSGTAMR